MKASPHPRTAQEHGSLAVFVAVFAVALFALVGMVVDGGRALAVRRQITDIAEQAARSGADQISVDDLRAGQIAIDPASATWAVERFLAAYGDQGTVTVSEQTVTVEVRVSVLTSVLGIIGLHQIPVSVSATAANIHGVAESDS